MAARPARRRVADGTQRPAGPRARTRGRPAPERSRTAPFLVRVAVPDDLESITRLRVALLRAEAGNPVFAQAHRLAVSRARALTRAQLQRPREAFFLATCGGAPVGVLRCRASRATPLVRQERFGAVTTAYVVPSQRRRGVLRALLAAADAWCRDRGLSGMRLHCGLENAVGLRAWNALGFTGTELLLVRPVPVR